MTHLLCFFFLTRRSKKFKKNEGVGPMMIGFGIEFTLFGYGGSVLVGKWVGRKSSVQPASE